jgi:hypothetical protein
MATATVLAARVALGTRTAGSSCMVADIALAQWVILSEIRQNFR